MLDNYPESDGRPLGETEHHRREIVGLIYALEQRYRDAPDVYVGGDLLIYYVQGDRDVSVCPDVFLVRGVAKNPPRRTFKVWEEGRAPSLVIEVTSASSRLDDQGMKKEKYALLGVEEYFLFDPLHEYLSPQLQGFRLAGGPGSPGSRYRAIQAGRDGSLSSEVTGLRLLAEDQRLRLIDRATGARLLRVDEEAAARRAAEARAAAAEEELARLRRELAARGLSSS